MRLSRSLAVVTVTCVMLFSALRANANQFAAMTKAGSQTIFVLGSQTYSNPNAPQVGAVCTAIMH